MMTDSERFMSRLNELTKETGIAIFGCGCCGSPRLEQVKSTDGEYEYRSGSDGRIEDIGWLYNVDSETGLPLHGAKHDG